MRNFGEQTGWSFTKEHLSPSFVSQQVAIDEALKQCREEGGEYYVYKLVAKITPKPREGEVEVLPEAPPQRLNLDKPS